MALCLVNQEWRDGKGKEWEQSAQRHSVLDVNYAKRELVKLILANTLWRLSKQCKGKLRIVIVLV